MAIFEFSSYKVFVNQKIKVMPKRGRGQYLKIAKHLGVHTTMVSHIFKGDSNLSVEQGLALVSYFGLNRLETDYFIALIQVERAADQNSKGYFLGHLKGIKTKATSLQERLEQTTELSEKNQAIFYSHWYYSAIRLLTALPGFQSPETIAESLGLPIGQVRSVIDFLLKTGLCLEIKGKVSIGKTRTYIGRESPMVMRHHENWRKKSVQLMDRGDTNNLNFTNPITISQTDFEIIREKLICFLEDFRKTADPSPTERLCCLNIDWFKIPT